ncbi:MAG TPA: hypothetical protein VGD07_00210 [Methylomirabilota bacterium]
MCIKMGCGARAGWTPSAACPGCPLVKAIRARQAEAKPADVDTAQPMGAIAMVREFLEATGMRR